MPAAPNMTEDELQRCVIDCAKLFGWLVHHTRPARSAKGWRTPVQGDAGFPDLVLVRAGRVLFVELKSARGSVRPNQVRWRDALPDERYRLWRPADWQNGTIESELRNL